MHVWRGYGECGCLCVGFRSYINLTSFIDYLLLTELSNNVDGLRYSTYIHKDNQGKLRMGPPWDYDLAWGNVFYAGCSRTTGFRHRSKNKVHILKLRWFERLLADRSVCIAVVQRWRELRRGALRTERIKGYIQAKGIELKEAAKRNFEKWGTLGRYVWPNIAPYSDSHTEELARLINWVQLRVQFLDGMRCRKPYPGKSSLLFSKVKRQDSPERLQAVAYLHEVGRAHRKGDLDAILRTASE